MVSARATSFSCPSLTSAVWHSAAMSRPGEELGGERGATGEQRGDHPQRHGRPQAHSLAPPPPAEAKNTSTALLARLVPNGDDVAGPTRNGCGRTNTQQAPATHDYNTPLLPTHVPHPTCAQWRRYGRARTAGTQRCCPAGGAAARHRGSGRWLQLRQVAAAELHRLGQVAAAELQRPGQVAAANVTRACQPTPMAATSSQASKQAPPAGSACRRS